MLTTEIRGGSGDEKASLKRPGLFVFRLPSLSDSVSRSWTLPPSVQQLLSSLTMADSWVEES